MVSTMSDLLSHSAYTLAAVPLVALSAVALYFSFQRRAKQLPPGPSGLPFFGSAFSLTSERPQLQYKELNDRYGDIVHVTALGQPIILVGSWEAANQLFSKRAGIYSNRPAAHFTESSLGLHEILPIAQYGPLLREQRRMYRAHLSKEQCRKQYRADIEAEACNYVLSAVQTGHNTPEDYEKALQKTFINSIYGIKVKQEDDEIFLNSLHGTALASVALIPGRFLVNLFPLLGYVPAWFPGAGWKKEGEYIRKAVHKMISQPFQKVREAEADGTAKPSFTLSSVRDETTLNDEELAKNSGAAFTAGAETTAAFVQYFIYAMLVYPDVQKKAQAELDRVVGRERLPTADDYADLPYLDSIIKEISRWRPVAPISVPHRLTKDDVYKGYLIPKGSIIVQNTWSISMDEKMYPNASEFNPDRFMVEDPPMDPRLFTFGVGRRVCPGMHYAEVVYIAAIMTMLATVDIVKAHDANGKEIPVQPGDLGHGKLINAPDKFMYQFRPRSHVAIDLLRSGAEA